ncbi:MAG: HdeD family acid-resistance protein [Candidatus Polarisedimenticolia bacterium]
MAYPAYRELADNWSWILLRGMAAILFGILALSWPQITLFALILLFGVYVAADGIFALVAAMRGHTITPRWWLAVVGVLGIGAAVVTFAWPGLTALALIIFIGVWALVRGITEIAGAIALRKEIENEWWLILDGALSVAFGLIAIFMPMAGALAMVWLIAGFAIVSGVLQISLALRLRHFRTPFGTAAAAH